MVRTSAYLPPTLFLLLGDLQPIGLRQVYWPKMPQSIYTFPQLLVDSLQGMVWLLQ